MSRKFELSERQAYRYLREASHLVRPVKAAEATVPVTLKLPSRTVEMLRNRARSSGMTMGAIVFPALKLNFDGLELRDHPLFRRDSPDGEGSPLVALTAVVGEA